MGLPKGTNNGNHGKKGRSGRKGYGIENAKKHLLEQAYWIVNKKLEKECIDLKEKEKIELAKQVVLKEMGNKLDLTSKGDKLEVAPIYAGKAE
jgi:hypothetical protein